jgi:hypothetical protein
MKSTFRPVNGFGEETGDLLMSGSLGDFTD